MSTCLALSGLILTIISYEQDAAYGYIDGAIDTSTESIKDLDVNQSPRVSTWFNRGFKWFVFICDILAVLCLVMRRAIKLKFIEKNTHYQASKGFDKLYREYG